MVPYEYGRFGTPTSEALSKAISGLYDAEGAVLLPSDWLHQLYHSSFCEFRDHILVTDSVYGSTRQFIKNISLE